MCKLGTVQNARKGQKSSDLLKDYINGFEHLYEISITEADVIGADEIVLRFNVRGGKEINTINGRRLKTKNKEMEIFNTLRHYRARVIIVRDLNEPDSEGAREYMFNPVINKFELNKVYNTDENGIVDEYSTEEEYEKLDVLAALCGLR